MRTLNRKLLRNLVEMRGPVIAITLIIGCGVASYVTVTTAYRGLTRSRDTYYSRYRMADVFAPMKRGPRAVLRDLKALPGVRQAEGRIVFDVTVDLPELAQPASGRVISVPDRRRRIVNDLHLASGHWFRGDGTREVIIGDGFARAHGLGIGDRVQVLMNNRKEALRIVGTALSPEFVYAIRPGQIIPDPERFTVLWLSQSFAEAVFDFKDACNDVVMTLYRGTSVKRALEAVDRHLDRFGGIGAYALEDQESDRYLSGEIDGLEASSTVVPAIFLGVAAFVLHMLMRRLIRTQRSQIAVFRAFGYSTGALMRHFLKLGLLVGFVGGAVGGGLGLWFSKWLTGVYQSIFDFPVLDVSADLYSLVLGLGVSLLFSALGAAGAVRAAAAVDPAEGMDPEPPPSYGRTFLERIGRLWHALGFSARMVLRHLSRRKLRALVTVGGVAMSTAILLVTFFARDGTALLVDNQFRLVERQDATVTFRDVFGRRAVSELRALQGVRTAEPELAIPVQLAHERAKRRTAIIGLAPDHTLLTLRNRAMRQVELPSGGLLLSRKLAELLGVRVGMGVEVEVLTGRKQRFVAPIAALVDDFVGVMAYAPIDVLSRWVDESWILTGARLSVDEVHAESLSRTLKDLPAVSAVTFKEQALQSWEETVSDIQTQSYTVLMLFAGIITFGVVYNSARISLAERKRELGSLRVLGYSNREVSGVVVGENVLLVVLALPPGLALGSWLSWLIVKANETDLYRFPFVIERTSYLGTIGLVLLFAVLANIAIVRRIRGMDIVEVLKARE